MSEIKTICSRYTNRPQLENAIQNLAYVLGTTSTNEAIDQMRTDVFTQDGDRPNVQNLAIIITDGKPFPDSLIGLSIQAAQQAQDDGIIMIAVGITQSIDEETLASFSSQPRILHQNYFTSPDFAELEQILQPILRQACPSSPTPMPTTTPAPTTPSMLGLLYFILKNYDLYHKKKL